MTVTISTRFDLKFFRALSKKKKKTPRNALLYLFFTRKVSTVIFSGGG